MRRRDVAVQVDQLGEQAHQRRPLLRRQEAFLGGRQVRGKTRPVDRGAGQAARELAFILWLSLR